MLYHISQSADEQRRSIQRLGPFESDAQLFRMCAMDNIDIIQRFHVVAGESDRHFEHIPMTITGKTQKYRMREIAIEELELMVVAVSAAPPPSEAQWPRAPTVSASTGVRDRVPSKMPIAATGSPCASASSTSPSGGWLPISAASRVDRRLRCGCACACYASSSV